jgi:hypothetical protein
MAALPVKLVPVELKPGLLYASNRSDPLDSPLRKLVWMIVAVAAMILLAPMAASAHEGHHAGTAVHVSTQHPNADRHSRQAAAAVIAIEAFGLATAWSPTKSDTPCAAGCCTGMACCGSAILPQGPSLATPGFKASQASPRAPPRLAGVRPTYHLQPPNALT